MLQRRAALKGHTPKECRRGAHLPFTGRWALRWINHYCLWRTGRLSYLPSLSCYSIRLPTEGWPDQVDLGGWLHTVAHPGTNQAQRYALPLLALIETNVLPLNRQPTANVLQLWVKYRILTGQGLLHTRGYKNSQFSTNILFYLRNNTRYGHGYNDKRIGTTV